MTGVARLKTSDVVLRRIPCDASVYVGAAVRIVNGVAFNAQANNVTNSNAVGICEEKITSTLCRVRTGGLSDPIFVGLDTTKNYFLSESVAGDIKTTIPTLTDEIILRMGKPFDATRLIVDLAIRIEIDNG